MMENVVIEVDSLETRLLLENLAKRLGLGFRKLDKDFLEEMEDAALVNAIEEGEKSEFVSEEDVREALKS